jgi:hypothetical protein
VIEAATPGKRLMQSEGIVPGGLAAAGLLPLSICRVSCERARVVARRVGRRRKVKLDV